MLIMAMDFNGIAFYELLPPGSTVDGEVYKSFLERKITEWLSGKDSRHLWLLHDNARPHKARVVKEFLIEKQISTWDHPPYSPDISPLDFCCFGQLKRKLRGIRFDNWDVFITAMEEVIEQLNREGHMKGIQQLPERWQRVIDAEGAYI